MLTAQPSAKKTALQAATWQTGGVLENIVASFLEGASFNSAVIVTAALTGSYYTSDGASRPAGQPLELSGGGANPEPAHRTVEVKAAKLTLKDGTEIEIPAHDGGNGNQPKLEIGLGAGFIVFEDDPDDGTQGAFDADELKFIATADLDTTKHTVVASVDPYVETTTGRTQAVWTLDNG